MTVKSPFSIALTYFCFELFPPSVLSSECEFYPHVLSYFQFAFPFSALGFWDWQLWFIPWKANVLKKSLFQKITQRMHFFFLEIKSIFSALIIWDYGQVVLSSGMWTKQKQPLERESSKFMAVSTCSVCQYLWCHNQIKTIPSAIYISMVPRLHRVMPKFLSRFKAIQLFRTLGDLSLYFRIHVVCLREGERIVFTYICFEVTQN